MIKPTDQLFVIGHDLARAVDEDSIKHTCAALRELGLYRLPYEKVTVRFLGSDVLSCKDNDTSELGNWVTVDFGITEVEDSGSSCIARNSRTGFVFDLINGRQIGGEPDSDIESTASAAYFGSRKGWLFADTDTDVYVAEQLRRKTADLLIALLATRNVVKTVKQNKLAKLGIGKGKYDSRFAYTTTISLPAPEEMEDDAEHPPTGMTKAPHLRRGHLRHQHYGPARQFIKRIWIEPVFVNADPSFVSTRKAYNVGFKIPEREPA